MDWDKALALSGPVIAALSLFLMYKERIKGVHHLLYNKQLEMYLEVIKHTVQLQWDVEVQLLNIPKGQLIPQDLKANFIRAFSDAIPSRNAWAAMLPEEVLDKIADLLNSLTEAVMQGKREMFDSEIPKRRSGLKATIRRHVGVDVLSEHTMKLLGAIEAQQMMEPK